MGKKKIENPLSVKAATAARVGEMWCTGANRPKEEIESRLQVGHFASAGMPRFQFIWNQTRDALRTPAFDREPLNDLVNMDAASPRILNGRAALRNFLEVNAGTRALTGEKEIADLTSTARGF